MGVTGCPEGAADGVGDTGSTGGANPFVGDWWVWFGGVAMADTPRVRQSVEVPAGQAMLRFGFSVNAGSGTGNDIFTVRLDDENIFIVSDAEAGAYGGWRVIELDVSRYADGSEHTLQFSASTAGAGVTNFFVDEVELLPCEEPAGSNSSAASSSSSSAGSSTGR